MANENGTTKEEQGGTTQAPAKQESQLAIAKRTIVDVVAAKVNGFIANGELNMPKDYSVNNAIKSAWLILQVTEDKNCHKALEVCTQNSIANALLDMVVQGLNPGKNQGYFIVYGKSLVFQRSYFGSMAVAKTVNQKIDDFAFAVVYKGDTFRYGIKNGKKIVSVHEQDIENIDKKLIVAAYCIALDKNGDPFKTEIMTFEEILQSWKQSKMNPVDANGNIRADSTHGKFTADMALKTVINKCCKAIINASSDNTLLLDRVNKNEELADRAEIEMVIEEEANKGPIIEVEAASDEESGGSAVEPEEDKQKGQQRAPGF